MIRVFARHTNKSPTDKDAYYSGPQLWQLQTDMSVFVSCTFTYDKPRAEQLAEQWDKAGYPVRIGGPAYNDRGGPFIPGVFVKQGCVITSRGCDNKCWFCSVPKREGQIREIPITQGYDVLDNNLLQCSEQHIRAVFQMLKNQKQRAMFTGGFEAAKLKDWHVNLLADLKPETLFLAYDTPDDYEPLRIAAKMLIPHVFTEASHKLQCYVLIGLPKDTIPEAQKRLNQVIELGVSPFAMLYRDEIGKIDPTWSAFRRVHCRKAIIHSRKQEDKRGTLLF